MDLNKATDNVHTLLSTSISLRTASSSVRVCRGPFHVDFVDVGVGVGRVEVPAPNPGVPQVDPEDRAAEDLQPVQRRVLQSHLCPVIVNYFRFHVNMV